MAKELSMIENNEKGRMARKYFIECEKIAIGKKHIEQHSKQIDKDVLAYRTMRAEAALIRAKEAKSKLLLKIAENETGTFSKVCKTLAVNTLCGDNTLQLPESGEKTLSAEDIAKRLGTNKNVIGRLATKHNLKTSEYGKWYHDKSPYSNKEIDTFRYFEKAVDKFDQFLKMAQTA